MRSTEAENGKVNTMYTDKYLGDFIGGTDDSLTLAAYLAAKQKEDISLEEIFADTGLARLNGDFRRHDEPLTAAGPEGMEVEFYYAIDLITDLACLLLECRESGRVSLCDFAGEEEEDGEFSAPPLRITATPDEHALMNRALRDFSACPSAYDISEMMAEEELSEMAEVCEELRKELYGDR